MKPTQKPEEASTRVDAPHASAAQTPARTAALVTAGAAEPAPQAVPPADELMRRQAGQIAERLRERQQRLDEREAALNARIAQAEQEMRAARLWMREREASLHERDQDLTERAVALHAQLASLQEQMNDASSAEVAAERELKRWQEELTQRQQALEAAAAACAEREREQQREELALEQARRRWREEQEAAGAGLEAERQRFETERNASRQTLRQLWGQLDRRRETLDAEEQRIRGRQAASAGAAVREELEALARQRKQLERVEAALRDQLNELEADRNRLAAEEKRVSVETAAAWQRISERQEEWEAELSAGREELARRGGQLAAREAALAQLHEEVGRLHRDSLELRVVTEELWSQLVAQAPPAEITKRLAALRRRLADEFQLTRQHVGRQQQEIVQLAARLDEQEQRLASRRAELEAWLGRRQEEIERQAEQLIARERELDAEARARAEAERAWEAERRDYQRQIRQLLAQVRSGVMAAA